MISILIKALFKLIRFKQTANEIKCCLFAKLKFTRDIAIQNDVTLSKIRKFFYIRFL